MVRLDDFLYIFKTPSYYFVNYGPGRKVVIDSMNCRVLCLIVVLCFSAQSLTARSFSQSGVFLYFFKTLRCVSQHRVWHHIDHNTARSHLFREYLHENELFATPF